MLISAKELREFEQFLDRVGEDAEETYIFKDGKVEGEINHWDYYADHPHFLMPMGFDEFVAFKNKVQFGNRWFANYVGDHGHTIYRKPSGQWLLLSRFPDRRNEQDRVVDSFGLYDKETFLQAEKWGERQSTFAELSKAVREGDGDAWWGGPRPTMVLTISEVLEKLSSIAGKFTEQEKTIWSPRLWTPSEQASQSSILQRGTKRILTALKSEKKSLADLSWKQLEELVAEILRAQGLEIHVVRESPQGGRDILARGELIPGEEPLTVAVEVKHKPVVDRPDVQLAIQQNKQFPALMFVTSGRFTAGVLQEKRKPENQLRLFLKDGVALGDLIRDYKLER